jgi:ABC-2 type transport system permease protein
MTLNRIHVLVVKELTQIRRDRRLLGILIMAPLFQLVIMGFAATTDIQHIALAVRDDDHSFHSREYVRAITSSGYFELTLLTDSELDDGQKLVAGQAGLILRIPPDFSHNLVSRRAAPVQVLVDGADSNFAVQGLNYLQRATRLYSDRLAREVRLESPDLNRHGLPLVRAESRAWYNPDLTSRWYMVPSLMGVLLMVVTMLVTSMSLVKELEEGTMEQIIVTPLRPGELIAGKLLPFVAIGFVEITLALAAIRGVFHVPLRGHMLTLYLLSALFLLTTLGLGLFISTLVRTQQQAMMLSTFFVMMPFVLLSGFIFPVENMPAAIQYVAALIPLKYYLSIVRALFLKGSGWIDVWRDAVVLLAWGLGILALATAKFHKRLD